MIVTTKIPCIELSSLKEQLFLRYEINDRKPVWWTMYGKHINSRLIVEQKKIIIRILLYAIYRQVYAWKLSSFKTEYASLLSWETNINFYILWQLTWSWTSRMLYMWYGDVCVYVCSVMSNSLQPRELEPTRLLCPWDSPGKILERVATSSSSGSSWPKYQIMSPASPVLSGWFFTTEPPGKAGCCSLLSRNQLFVTPWTAACQASLSFTISWCFLKLMSIELVMPSRPPHPRSPPSPPDISLSQHQGLFQWVGFSHQVAKVLELQLQHQSFQWIFRTNFL